MNRAYSLLVIAVLVFSFSCEETSTSSSSTTTTTPDTTTDVVVDTSSTTDNTSSTPNTGTIIPDQKDCEVADKHFEKNIFKAKDAAQMICIVANQSTHDVDLGDSHRILEVLDTKDCSTLLEKTLPVNRSADFPYYIVPATYESINQIIAIQGFSSTFYYDVKNKSVVGPIIPQFYSDREAVDAQSGMVKGLTVWDKYLMGRSVDFGNFAFDLSDVKNPKPILPVAEYLIPNTAEYNSLFLLATGNGGYQAVIPTTDIDAGGNMFELGTIFPQSLMVDPNVAKNVRDNRFIILNDKTNSSAPRKVAVDMFSKKWIDIPENLEGKKTKDVLDWLNSSQ